MRNYVTGIHEVGSASEDMERDLQDLLDEIREYSGENALKVGSYFHARFDIPIPLPMKTDVLGERF